MNNSSEIPGSAARGMSRLAFNGIAGLIGMVETMHGNIAGHSSVARNAETETRGITRLVYRAIRGVTRWSGAGVDVALSLLDPILAAEPLTPGQEALQAALNGVLGDHLAETSNPLAIPMRLRRQGLPLRLDRNSLTEALTPQSGRLVVLLHGLCLNDRHWHRDGHDHGAALARDLGYTPLYLHYNTGLHISANGQAFADLLQTLVDEWPVRIEELVIIGHSMGGLVSRSACHYGALKGHDWLRYLRKLIFLGTPHHGAPMERGGQWLHLALDKSRYTAAFTHLARIRSAGITDLRYGNLLDSDWQDKDRFNHVGDARQAIPLPEGVYCFAIAASTGNQANGLRDRLLGDGLVPVGSALGQHDESHRSLSVPESRQWIGRSMSHFDLLSHSAVYKQITLWLGS